MVATVVSGCGSGGPRGAGNPVDQAFIASMVPHHRAAVAMAKLALDRAEHPELKQLARDIVSTQNGEITTMELIEHDLDESDVSKGDLGVPPRLMGMASNAAMLRNARPFDRAFIDVMVSHHRGAMRMARAELARGQSPALRQMAERIAETQAKEIDRMRSWRRAWYPRF